MEWQSVMGYFKERMAAAIDSSVWRTAVGRQRPIWSFDNDKIHQNRLILAQLKINHNNRYPLPPNSPDMHRVVERCIGRLKTKFADWLYDHPGKCTMAEYKRALLDIFMSTQTSDVINRDVKKLPQLFPLIVKAKGGWPPKGQL